MPSVHRIASIAAVSFAAFWGGGSALAQVPVDKAANSQQFATCVTESLQEAYRQEFQKAAQGPVRAGDEASIVNNVIIRLETQNISLSCMSKISGVARENMPSLKDERQFGAFFHRHFEANAFTRALEAVGKIMPAVEAEGLAILKRKSDPRPS